VLRWNQAFDVVRPSHSKTHFLLSGLVVWELLNWHSIESTPFWLPIVLLAVFDFPGLKALWKLLRTHSGMGERSRRTSRLCCSEPTFFRKPRSDWEGQRACKKQIYQSCLMNNESSWITSIQKQPSLLKHVIITRNFIIIVLIDQILFITFNNHQNYRTIFLSRLALARVDDHEFCTWGALVHGGPFRRGFFQRNMLHSQLGMSENGVYPQL
jgi:hypothetical protein